ncbi:hypothetical protein AYI69_g10414, partial [Smittium culicis]
PVVLPVIKKIILRCNSRPSVSRYILDEAEDDVATVSTKRLNVAHLSVIYPEGIDDLESVKNYFLASKKVSTNLKSYLIGFAKNTAGTLLIHCYLYYSPKKNLKSHKSYEFQGLQPTVTSIRSKEAVIKLCFSEDTYLTNFDLNLIKKFRLSAAQRVNRAKTITEAKKIIDDDPALSMKFLNNPQKMLKNIKFIINKTGNPGKKTNEFKEITEIKHWDRTETCLWLHGVLRMGNHPMQDIFSKTHLLLDRFECCKDSKMSIMD